MKDLVIGQVGCGYWGPNLLRVFHELPGARVKWLCELKSGRLDWARERWRGLAVTSRYDEMLADPEVGAVVVATEVVTHAPLVEAALKAGKHVFVEKPMTNSSRAAEALAELAAARKLTLAVGHVFVHHPAVDALKAELESGRLGKLCYLDLARVNPGPPAPKHNVIWDMAPHDAAIALHLAGGAARAVRATGRRYLRGDLDEAAFFEVDFTGPALARVHVGWLSSRRVRRVEVYAERGALFYDDVEPFEKVRIVSPGQDTRVAAKAGEAKALYYGAGDIRIPALPPEEPLRRECVDFVEAVRAGRAPRSGPDMGVAVVRILEAACLSAEQGGREVKLS
ncbi:MAG: Gfo/Idh/MocA family oxidoreductase [Elusimicrobia bacterium]|nr:Gfo/Idh/MocA family oxidoreductase [Elusimicrobiota bacterium]